MSQSAHARIAELTAALEQPLDERSQRLREELIALIESGLHIILGARATMFYTKPRYTADIDYAVGKRDFAEVRRWFEDSGVAHEFNGEAIECPALGVDVIDGSQNAVIEAVLARDVAAISPTRAYERKQQDAADLVALVLRPGFDDGAFLQLMVGPYAAELQQARTVLADIKAHRNLTL